MQSTEKWEYPLTDDEVPRALNQIRAEIDDVGRPQMIRGTPQNG